MLALDVAFACRRAYEDVGEQIDCVKHKVKTNTEIYKPPHGAVRGEEAEVQEEQRKFGEEHGWTVEGIEPVEGLCGNVGSMMDKDSVGKGC